MVSPLLRKAAAAAAASPKQYDDAPDDGRHGGNGERGPCDASKV
jgi:hypothetical protein